MRLVEREEIEATVDIVALVDHLEACHREAPMAADDLLMGDPRGADGKGSEASMLCRLAWQGGKALALKFGPIFPQNAEKGLPTVATLVALFDGETGRPVAVFDGHAITNWKTATDSALAQRHLARDGAERLLMVGAGTLAPYLIRAHLAVRPSLKRVTIWNRSSGRAQALIGILAGLGIEADVAADLPSAVESADVISTATMATEPLVQGAWLKPGTHLDLVGAFTPQMREADVEAIRRGRLFVDNKGSAFQHSGELLDAFAAGLAEENVVDLYQVCGEAKGRLAPEEITVFKNAGGGHLDLMTTVFVAERLGLMA